MDRDHRWDRTKSAFDAMVSGIGAKSSHPIEAINKAYEKGITDEFIPATVIGSYSGMEEGDAVMCLNFRADRARQILAAIGDPEFDAFDTSTLPQLSLISGFTEYSKAHSNYMDTVFPECYISNTLGSWVASKGLRQFRIAETEKYPHVTFFLNGGIECPAEGECRCLVASPKVSTYDLKPEMSSAEVTSHLCSAIRSRNYALIVVNFANPDMVGHTGDLKAAIKAVEATDRSLGMTINAVTDVSGTMIVCSDHGNCETMVDLSTGGPHTTHTTNAVPVILVNGFKNMRLTSGRLADLAPTLLELMQLDKPLEMTGESLIIK